MQKVGEPQFISAHNGIVQGVAFDPMDRHKFCFGSSDGRIYYYNALEGRMTMTVKMSTPNGVKNVSAVKFNADGSRLLTTTYKRLSVLDAERGQLINSYDNCAYPGRDRAPLATHPDNPNLAVCGCTNGMGYITFDLRKQQPYDFSLNVHTTIIKDIVYIDESWPFSRQGSILSLDSNGFCKIRYGSGEIYNPEFYYRARSNCVCPTPESFCDNKLNGSHRSMVLVGGDALDGFTVGSKHQELHFDHFDKPIQRMKFTSNGHFLYIATGEKVQRWQRFDRGLKFLNEVYSHKDDIVDMDISQTDEYIITASKDGTVGLGYLGVPSHGWTAYMELA